MGYEHQDCDNQINELQETVESLKSDNEDLKYYYLLLLEDYSIILSN